MAEGDGWGYAEPCPICDHRGWCRESGDGAVVLCFRDDTGRGPTASGGYLHFLDDPDPSKRRERPPLALIDPEEAAFRDLGYRAVLGALGLSPGHRASLLGRGLTPDAIDRAGYRTNGRTVYEQDPAGALNVVNGAPPALPGLRRGERRGGRYDVLLGPEGSGFIVPVRDPAGRIVHHVLARDDREPKYQWPAGAGVHVHVPLHQGRAETVRVTEGILKADVATALGGTLTIGLPGLAWRWALPALATLEAHTVLVAFDVDKATNPAVLAAERDLVDALRSAGYRAEVETWDPASGKGLDDVLAAGADITRRATGPKRMILTNRKALTWKQAIR